MEKLIPLRPPVRGGTPRRPPLQDANVLVVEGNWATATLLRDRLETEHLANVEVVSDYEDALDVLGTAAKPISLLMLDPSLPATLGDTLLRLLREHKARIHVTLHGNTPPEALPHPCKLVGAAAYTHLATSAIACTTAAAVMAQGLTVREIITRRTVPPSLDWQSAVSIYGAEPGQPFPLSLRT